MRKIDKFLEFKEIFKGVIRNFISYLAHHYPAMLDFLREYLKKARFNFTVEKLRWRQNTTIISYLSTPVHSEIYGTGEYEKNEIDFLQKTLKKGDTFIDVGANIGVYTVVAGRLVGDEGRVFAFEPSKREFELLLKNIKLNKLKNIHPVKAAISNHTGTTKLRVASGLHTGTNTLALTFCNPQTKLCNIEEVPAYRLDDFIIQNNLKNVTGVKIDIEGYELFALQGMQYILNTFKPFLMLEINEYALQSTSCNKEQIFAFLRKCNYKIFYYDNNGMLTENFPEYINKVCNSYYDIVCIHESKCNCKIETAGNV